MRERRERGCERRERVEERSKEAMREERE